MRRRKMAAAFSNSRRAINYKQLTEADRICARPQIDNSHLISLLSEEAKLLIKF